MRTAVIEKQKENGEIEQREIELPSPLGSLVLVKIDKDYTLEGYKASQSSIILADSIESKLDGGGLVGDIIEIGPCAFKGERFEYVYGQDWDVKVGDKVMFKMSSGLKVPHSEGKYQLVDDQNLIGVFK